MATDDYRRLICTQCGGPFTKIRRDGRIPRICDTCHEERATRPRRVYRKQCTQCGKGFVSLVHWASKCSAFCKKAAYKARDPERALRQQVDQKKRAMARDPYKRRVLINRVRRLLVIIRGMRAKSERLAEIRMLAALPCDTCGKPVGTSSRGQKRKYCCKECRDNGSVTKAIRRTASLAYLHARVASTIQRFDPIEVLERDGWRCQICGVSTPRSRRGTNHFNAPEVDHVIPISKNGAHSMANVQCACKRCNRLKSNKYIVGQSPLFS